MVPHPEDGEEQERQITQEIPDAPVNVQAAEAPITVTPDDDKAPT